VFDSNKTFYYSCWDDGLSVEVAPGIVFVFQRFAGFGWFAVLRFRRFCVLGGFAVFWRIFRV